MVGGHVTFYTKQKVKDALEEYREKLQPYKLPKPLQGALQVNVRFYYKGKGVWKDTRPDLDNMVKLLLDAMTQEGFWEDDGQIVMLSMAKMYGEDDGVEIGITRL